MTVKTQKETLGFQTEVNQLLKLVINSLYSNPEVFLRELVSNASDAIDKLRFASLSDNALYEGDSNLLIDIAFDKEAKTVTITDNGIGMDRDEVIQNIGTIAKSGTKEFLSALTGDKAKDSEMIGQFGVGFYASFIVADKVTLITRRAGLTSEHGVRWESNGEGEYSLENIERSQRGTQVILHLKDDAKEFLDGMRLRNVITKYSDHITVPIMMEAVPVPTEDDKDKEKPAEPEHEQVNKATALWTLAKDDVKEEEYNDLYKHIAHDFENPLAWSHNHVEGKFQYTTLLYIPARAPFDLYQREHKQGMKLYVKRVYIMDDAENLMPNYLRFVRGIVDSSDLPLNVSREILQNNKLITNIRSASVKKILSLLESMAKNDQEKYAKFWKEFGKVLKEGPAEDFANRERISKLLRFSTTTQAEETVSFEEYVTRMQDKQEVIYYLTSDSYEAANSSPHLEIFRKKNIEVLLLCDPVDEWLMSQLSEFDGKKLQSVTKGNLDLGELEDKEIKETQEKEKTEFESILKQMQEVLGEKVKEVRITHRLTDSPACVVADDSDMDLQMQRIMESMGQSFANKAPVFEINPQHQIIQHIHDIQDETRFSEWTNILFDQAILAEGGQLKDPANYVQRLNGLLLDVAR